MSDVTITDKSLITFEPKVESDESITMRVRNDAGTLMDLSSGDKVTDDAAPTSLSPNNDAVEIQVKDYVVHSTLWYEFTITVGGNNWLRKSGMSFSTREIPYVNGDKNQITVSVSAKDNSGTAISGTTTQIIIIKRRPPV